MITNRDRSFYIGASDTAMVVGKWTTKSFEKWWRTKQGFDRSDYQNAAMLAGTFYEKPILESLGLWDMEFDKQIIKDRLRVNLDGNTHKKIYEVKTYRHDKGFKVTTAYRNQVMVEMYAAEIYSACIVAYGLIEGDYDNYYHEIDVNRLSFHDIPYDSKWIEQIYLPRLEHLSKCLEDGVFPKYEDQRY